MNRLYVSIGLLIVITAACISCLFYLNSVYNYSINLLDEVYEDTVNGNYDQAYKKSTHFSEYWEKNERSLILFVRHQNLDEISQSSVQLPEYIAFKDLSKSCATIKMLLNLLETIWTSEQPTFHSIF